MPDLKIKNFFSQHYLAIILAFLVGFSIVFPQLLFIFQAGDQYQGFNIFETDGEYYYLARIREVYDGHYAIANPLMVVKDLPYVYPPLPELLVGFTGLILNLSIASVVILFRFAAPFFLFLLIYFLVLKISNNKAAALSASILIMLASNLVSYPQDLLAMIQGNFFQNSFAEFARPINPQISSFLFFGFLYSFWQLLHTNKKRYFYSSLLLFGLSFYTYIYTWTFLTVFIGLEFIITWWQKQKSLAFKILLVLLGGFVAAIPYFINFYNLTHHFSYQSLVFHFGLHSSHEFVFSKIILLSLLLLLGLRFLKKHEDRGLVSFFFILILSGFIATNQQLITGRVMEYGHYHWYFNKPVLLILFGIFIFEFFGKIKIKKFHQNLLLLILICLAFFNIYDIQISSYYSYFNKYLFVQKYEPVIDWFNDNAQKDQVVYVPGAFVYPIEGRNPEMIKSRWLAQFIVIYTPLNLYYDFKSGLNLLPYEGYDIYNLLLTLKILDIKPEVSLDYLKNHSEILSNIYGAYFKARGLTYDDIPDGWLELIIFEYQDFYQQPWSQIFSRYPLNYIAWDKDDLPDLPFVNIEEEAGLNQVFEKNGLIIYKFQ